MAESRIKDENYRQKYMDHYGIEIGDYFDIHHIDFDRSNNDISNLILLPRSLHQRYHQCLIEISGITDISKLKTINIRNGCPFEYDALLSFCEVMNEINKWKARKVRADWMIAQAEWKRERKNGSNKG